MRITVKEVTVPVPCSGTSSHCRSWQRGQSSLGGIARSPQLRQRIAESRPARASSKNPLSVITRSVTAEQAHEHRGGVAAQRVHQTGGRALDLARARFAAELGGDLADLRGTGRADGMSL